MISTIPPFSSPFSLGALALSLSLMCSSLCCAQLEQPPVGHFKTPCLSNSDTVVGIPVREHTVWEGVVLNGPNYLAVIDPATNKPIVTGPANLELTDTQGVNFTPGQFANTHYVRFIQSGRIFVILGNGTNDITIDAGPEELGGIAVSPLEIQKFMTLDELFPPNECTQDATTTGNAIVASVDTTASGRRTEILYPDIVSEGSNLSASAVYYVYNNAWRKEGEPTTTDFGSTALWPDVYFTIRQPSSVASATTYTTFGEIDRKPLSIPLRTKGNADQDNHIGLPRPIGITLNQLNLGGTSIFMESVGTQSSKQRDKILVFDNTQALINKTPSSIYFHHNGMWKKDGQGDTDFGNDVIPPGVGFIIRKYKTGGGPTTSVVYWKYTPNYQ